MNTTISGISISLNKLLFMIRYISFFAILLLISCSHTETQNEASRLGTANLEVGGSPQAQEAFKRGLLLLYSFEYEDARESFEKAIETDSTMAMAYWGVAMTYNHPLWRTQFTDSAQAILKLRADRHAAPQSELEEDFLSALDILYEDGKQKEDRDKNYAEYFKKLYKKYPNNPEVASFYSLSLLGSVGDGRSVETYEKAGEIASEVLENHPEHPGALHYLIHAYDDPDHATLALEAADSYAKVAPEASHALHMPSHIFVAMGMWDRVIASNIDAYDASVARMERKGLKDGARSYHAYAWLQYGYLQKGDMEEARNMLDKMVKHVESDPTQGARSYLADMKGRYIIESNDKDYDFANIVVDVSDLNVIHNAICHFQDGWLAFEKGDAQKIDTLITSLDADIRRQALYLDTADFVICLPIQRSAPFPSDIAGAKAISFQLKALKSWIENDNSETQKFLTQSIATSDTLSFSYGPPEIQKPPHELYADWLITQNRYEEAIKHYNIQLERAPGRRLCLEGIEKATALMSKSSLAVH